MSKGMSKSTAIIQRLLEERRQYEAWIARLNSSADATPGNVRARVREDYEARLVAVMEELKAHAESARQAIQEKRYMRGERLLFLQLAAHIPLFLDRLPGALGVGLELLHHRHEPGLVVLAHARPHVPRGRVRRAVQARDPGFVLAPLLQQPLDDGCALRHALRHLAPVGGALPPQD